jgi:hypothetical protein
MFRIGGLVAALCVFATAAGCGETVADGNMGVCHNTGTTGEGDACERDGDCLGALTCQGAFGCGVACADDAACGTGNCIVGGSSPNNTPSSCVDACDHVASCVQSVCSENIFPAIDCIPACRDQGFADEVANLTCDDVNDLLLRQACADEGSEVCQCPVFTSNVGDACEDNAGCMSDALSAICIAEINADSMEASGFPGGYCIALGCQNDYECGDTGLCVTVDSQGQTLCIRQCITGAADQCRDGYVCGDVSDGGGVGACLPACTEDADCGTGFHCDVPSGECI